MARTLGSKDKGPRKRRGSNPVRGVACVLCGDPFKTRRIHKKPRCKKCVALWAVDRKRFGQYHKRPEYKAYARSWRLKKYYDLTPEQFDAMEKSQDGKCAICHLPPLDGDVLVVDHDHSTGKLRQLLCQNCNRALGAFKDSVSNLQSAAGYLIRHQTEGVLSEPELG